MPAICTKKTGEQSPDCHLHVCHGVRKIIDTSPLSDSLLTTQYHDEGVQRRGWTVQVRCATFELSCACDTLPECRVILSAGVFLETSSYLWTSFGSLKVYVSCTECLVSVSCYTPAHRNAVATEFLALLI